MIEIRLNQLVMMRMLSLRLGIAFCVIAVTVGAKSLAAQPAPCGITSIRTTKDLVYPPIARAARISGEVIVLVDFALDGSVGKLNILSGPEMLRDAADVYVKSFRANEYSGPRQCPIVISFAIGKEVDRPQTYVERPDLQHARITADVYPPSSIQYSVAAK